MDPAKREAWRQLGLFVAERWSWRRFAKVTLALVSLMVVGTWLFGGLNTGWLRHIAFQTERTEVTITGVGDPGGESCGKRARGERQEISWAEGGESHTGWYLACGSAQAREVGDSFTAWPQEGDRAYDYPPGEMWRWMLPILSLIGFVITVIAGTRLPDDEVAVEGPDEQQV